MNLEESNINWALRALRFITQMGVVDKFEPWESIILRSMNNLRGFSFASKAVLIKVEDSITTRLIDLDKPDLNTNYIEASLFQSFESITKPLLLEKPFQVEAKLINLLGNPSCFALLPVRHVSGEGLIVLSWDDCFEFSEEFSEFLISCLAKINETAGLSNTHYALEELKARFNAILQTVSQAIVFIDDSGKSSWVNDKAATLFQLENGSNAPAKLSAAMQELRNTADNSAEIFRIGVELFKSKNKAISDWKWIFRKPELLVLNVCCTPTISEHATGMLWTFDDITRQFLFDEHLQELNVRLEERSQVADEQNRAKSDFLANMSHEIRTPMNGVIGMTSLLRNTHLNEDQYDYVESIRVSADALLEIINEILDFSKIESGKLELEEHSFFIHKVIEETYDLLAPKAYEKNIDLLYQIDPRVPVEVIGDMTRLRQIVVNLVGNAIKFTPEGEILTSINLVAQEGNDYELEFSVRDSGIGIPANKIHKLFNSFSQVDSSTTRKYGGTGLGLAICAKLVEKMKGKIWVESEIDRGTTFRFTIKISARSEIKEFKINTQQKELLGKTALLIDDNKTNLKLLKGHCESWGMHADTALSGAEGLLLIDKDNYDVVIIDYLMPKMNGIELALAINELYGNSIPLVLFSSAGQFPVEHQDNRNLFAAVLDKPIKQAYFQKMLVKLLSQAAEPATKTEQGQKEGVFKKGKPEEVISILVAEDNIINQKIVVNAFKMIGYSCDVVSNGLEVLSSLKRQHYSLILMDVQMPEMDGLQATREIIRLYGRTRPVIIAMTAGAYEKDRQECLEAGMDDFLTKPFDFENLYNKFAQWKDKTFK